jgi:hypothetical protein
MSQPKQTKLPEPQQNFLKVKLPKVRLAKPPKEAPTPAPPLAEPLHPAFRSAVPRVTGGNLLPPPGNAKLPKVKLPKL